MYDKLCTCKLAGRKLKVHSIVDVIACVRSFNRENAYIIKNICITVLFRFVFCKLDQAHV